MTPTGIDRTEWSEAMKLDLDGIAEAIDRDRDIAAMRAAKADVERSSDTHITNATNTGAGLRLLQQAAAGGKHSNTMQRSPIPAGDLAPQRAQALKPTPPHTLHSPPARTLTRSTSKPESNLSHAATSLSLPD